MLKTRPAIIADSPALARIQVDSYRTAYAGHFSQAYLDHFTSEEEIQDWQSLLSADDGGILLVAENEQGGIIGYALAKAELASKGQFDSSLTAIHVHPSYYRQGAGRQLLIAMVKALQEQGCQSLWLSTLPGNPAQFWYERLGGVSFAREHYQVDDRKIVETKYGWSDMGVLLQYVEKKLVHPMTNKQVLAALENDDLVDISTTGRKTGQTHRFEIWFHYLDRQIYLSGKPGKRDWYANMVAHPEIKVHLKQSEQVDLLAYATPIADEMQRQRV